MGIYVISKATLWTVDILVCVFIYTYTHIDLYRVDSLVIEILVSECTLIYNFNIKGEIGIQIVCVTLYRPSWECLFSYILRSISLVKEL